MDDKIIALINRKEEEGIRLLIEVYYSELYRFCYNLISNRSDVEDMLQNVFIELWSKGLPQSIHNLKAYLFQIIKFKVYDHWSKQKDLSELTAAFNSVCSSEASVLEDLIAEETYERIFQALETLTPATRKVFELNKLEYKSLDEIALELNLSKQTVKNQLSTALAHLKLRLNIKR